MYTHTQTKTHKVHTAVNMLKSKEVKSWEHEKYWYVTRLKCLAGIADEQNCCRSEYRLNYVAGNSKKMSWFSFIRNVRLSIQPIQPTCRDVFIHVKWRQDIIGLISFNEDITKIFKKLVSCAYALWVFSSSEHVLICGQTLIFIY